jgi:hypothetical protein
LGLGLNTKHCQISPEGGIAPPPLFLFGWTKQKAPVHAFPQAIERAFLVGDSDAVVWAKRIMDVIDRKFPNK